MRINFRQGIISYPVSGSSQAFLAKSGSYVNLQASSHSIEIAIAHKDTDYLISETTDVSNAWGPIPVNTTCWLYWDIDQLTAMRTFGFTTLTPLSGGIAPNAPVEGLHWFDTTNNIHYVYQSGNWRQVVRVFAGSVLNSTFGGMGTGFPTRPFAGTQVGLVISSAPGHIITDSTDSPIRRSNGTFFTTESDFFINGSPINSIRLESNVVSATAVEMMAEYQIVTYSDFGRVRLADYDDIGSSVVAIVLQDLLPEEVGTVCIQGQITNPNWDWSTVGALLWVSQDGLLTETDPHVANAYVYPTGRVPVARVISPTSIIFDQGLGGKGDKGEPGLAYTGAYASAVVIGITRLSVTPADLNNPIAVGDNDPRLTNAVQKTGDTMTGPLILSGDPVVPLGAATKQYVDAATGADLSGLVQKSGDTMTGYLILNADPTVALGASTKQYVDNFVTRVNVFSANQSSAPVTLTDAANIAVDAALSNNFRLVLTGDHQLSNPTNMTDGMVLNFFIKQDGVGSHTLTYDTKYDFGDAGTPMLSTAATTRNFLSCYYDASDDRLVCSFHKGA